MPKDSGDSVTPHSIWTTMHSNDPKTRNFLFAGLPTTFLHPTYVTLQTLLEGIAVVLTHDYHWAPVGVFDDDEYVHEAIQRMIINFLVEHKESAFLDLPVAPGHRKLEIDTRTVGLSTKDLVSRCSGMEGCEPIEDERPSKSKTKTGGPITPGQKLEDHPVGWDWDQSASVESTSSGNISEHSDDHRSKRVRLE